MSLDLQIEEFSDQDYVRKDLAQLIDDRFAELTDRHCFSPGAPLSSNLEMLLHFAFDELDKQVEGILSLEDEDPQSDQSVN